MMFADFRTEKDSMGEMSVPADALYGASTARAVKNFPISGQMIPLEILRAILMIKRAAAKTNAELGVIEQNIAEAIGACAEELMKTDFLSHFPVDVFQTGSGTSTNMNANEVLAKLATERLGKSVHPNDHLNAGQSSNDVFPSAIHIAVAILINRALIPFLETFRTTLERKSIEFASLKKSGRTHLQDATPLTLGQEFSGYAVQVKKSITRLEAVLPDLFELAIGGTAVGTGVNAHPEFGARVAARLAEEHGLPFKEAANHFEAQSSRDACLAASAALRGCAVSLSIIAENIRWLGSDAIGEIALPAVQPGSSIMPGKVNPVLCEALLQVCAQVIGNDTAVLHGALMSNFQLNTAMPLIARNLIESVTLLANAVAVFDERCVQGILANEATMQDHLEHNLMLITALAPIIGYEKCAEIAKLARSEHLTLREAMRKSGVSEEEIEKGMGKTIPIQ